MYEWPPVAGLNPTENSDTQIRKPCTPCKPKAPRCGDKASAPELDEGLTTLDLILAAAAIVALVFCLSRVPKIGGGP
jgi:hypothetical protein